MEKSKKIEEHLREINKILNKHTKDNLREYDLTLPRFHLLLIVLKYQPVNMGTLHNKLYLAMSTLTVIVDHLVSDNLVKRYRDSEDRRVVLLEITEKGERKINDILEKRQQFFHETLSVLSICENDQLLILLDRILKKLKTQL